MNELRKDYFLDRWVIIAKDRGQRPDQFAKKKKEENSAGSCFFCAGHENETPSEISRIEECGRWIIRCFPNKFPATSDEFVDVEGPGDGLLVKRSAYGRHEIIVETPEHEKNLGDLEVGHIARLIDMYAQRLEENRKDPRIKHVMLFKNQGGDAGTSIEHTHSQLISLCIVPTDVRDEVEASKRYIRERCSCPLCDTWMMEVKGERRVLEDDRVAVFAPYASRFPFQAVIIPKRHTTSLEFLDMDERLSLAFALKQVLSSLNSSLNYPAYNFYFHTAPKGEDLHFHIDVCPRISKWAGFELGGGVIINTMPPETAAGHYRDLLKQNR